MNEYPIIPERTGEGYRFLLREVLYHGRMQLHDSETEYTRYMVIGNK